jgi:hypothetical protein
VAHTSIPETAAPVATGLEGRFSFACLSFACLSFALPILEHLADRAVDHLDRQKAEKRHAEGGEATDNVLSDDSRYG